MKSSGLLEFLGVAFVVTLIVAGGSFLFSSYNHYFLSRMGAILVKIAGVMLGMMLLIYLSEVWTVAGKRLRKLAPVSKKLVMSAMVRRICSVAFGLACGLGIFLYFYQIMSSFTWLAWFFAAVLIMSFVAVQFSSNPVA